MMNTHLSRLLFCAATVLFSSVATALEAVPIDGIVAVANENVILQSELDRAVEQIKNRLQGEVELPPRDVLEEQLLERLLLTELQLQLAEANGVQVSEKEVGDALKRMAARNNMTLAQLHDTIIADGYEFSGFRADLRDQLIIRKLQTKVAESRVTVTDSEVDIQLSKLPDQDKAYHLANIMIAVPQGADAEAIGAAAEEMKQVFGDVRAGQGFAQAAIAHSDAQNALQGGDLGWLRAEQIPPIFIDMVEDLEPGEVAQPVRGAGGFYLIQLIDERQAQPVMVQEKHARHIVIEPDALTTDQEAYREIAALRDQIVNDGGDFAELARKRSDDSLTAAQGGDLGWFGPLGYGTKFDQVLAKLEPGDVSTPFRTGAGWHIVQLLDRRASDRTEELRAQRAKEAIFQRKKEEQIDAWLQQMRAKAYVDIRL